MSATVPRVGRQAAVGGMLMVAARFITRLIDMATMLGLARILVPKDFGIVAIAASMVAITEAILELPLNQALLRLPVISREQYDTAFTLSLLRGALLSSILVLGSVPFSRFYGDHRLVLLVCVLSIGPCARGLTSPRLAEYQKVMSFWRDFAIELGGKLTGFGVGVVTALMTHSYWAIAIGSITYPVATSLGSYRLAPYRPRLTLSELAIFSDFVGWMSIAQIVSAVNWQFERLLIGKLRPLAQLGLFTTANDVAGIPYMSLFGPLLRPMLAAFALLREDPQRLARSYQTATCGVVAVGLPLLVGESLLAEPMVRLILGAKWLGAVPLVRGLALSLTPALFALPSGSLFMSLGRTRIFVQRNALELSVKLPSAIAGIFLFGFGGIIAARFVSELAANAYSIVLIRRALGLSVREQVLAPWRSVASSALMVVPVVACRDAFGGAGDLPHVALTLVVSAVVGSVSYGLAGWALWRACGRPYGVESLAMGMLSGIWARMCDAVGRLPLGRRYGPDSTPQTDKTLL